MTTGSREDEKRGDASGIPKAVLELYARQRRMFEGSLDQICSLIEQQLGKLPDRHLVRASVRDFRVKEIGSLWAKAQSNKWEPHELFEKAHDILGIRIVCQNLEDVYRARDLVLAVPSLRLIEGSEQDYFKSPKDSYRGLHFLVGYAYRQDNAWAAEPMTCEIQVRTYLADAWARLSHQDFYKQATDLPTYLHKSLARLSSLLSVADDVAQDIREEISLPRHVEQAPEGEEISLDSLAFIYRDVFGTDPPDYVLRLVSARCSELGVTRSDALARKLRDDNFVERLSYSYQVVAGWSIQNETVLELVVEALVFGDEIAIQKSRDRAHVERAEVDQIYDSEILSNLPDTLEGFLQSELKKPDQIYAFCEVFGATERCAICGGTVVDADRLAENIADHYHAEDKSPEISAAIIQSEVETGDFDDPQVCSYCAQLMRRDD